MCEIQQQQVKTTTKKPLQKFPQEHPPLSSILFLLQVNPNTSISSFYSNADSPSFNVIVIWSKSAKSSPLYMDD